MAFRELITEALTNKLMCFPYVLIYGDRASFRINHELHIESSHNIIARSAAFVIWEGIPKLEDKKPVKSTRPRALLDSVVSYFLRDTVFTKMGSANLETQTFRLYPPSAQT